VHRAALAGVALAAAVAVATTAAVMARDPAPTALDRALHAATRGWADPWGWPVHAAGALGWATAPLRSTVVAVVVVLVLLRLRLRAAAAFVALSSLLGVTASQVVKNLVDRQRPPGAEAHVRDMAVSFPSGHSMLGIYLYVATGMVLVQLGRAEARPRLARLGWAAVALGPLIGVSRLVLGVHWATDVVAGWSFGSLAALVAALLLWDRLARGWPEPAPVPLPAAAGPGQRSGTPGQQVTKGPSPPAGGGLA